MAKKSFFGAIIACVMGLLIGVVVTAVLNLMAGIADPSTPVKNLVGIIVAVCLSSSLSALVGFLFAARPKKEKEQGQG